jgi:hypothetical protein
MNSLPTTIIEPQNNPNQGITVEFLSCTDKAFVDILAELRAKHDRQSQLIRKLESLGGAHEQV